MTIIIRSVFEEDGKLYPQVFLDDAFYDARIQQNWYFRKDWC